MLEQTLKSVVVHKRTDSGFVHHEYGAGDEIELPIPGLTLDVDRAYEAVPI